MVCVRVCVYVWFDSLDGGLDSALDVLQDVGVVDAPRAGSADELTQRVQHRVLQPDVTRGHVVHLPWDSRNLLVG